MESKELMVRNAEVANPALSIQRKEVATGLFKSGMFPNVKNEFGAFAVVQYGAELGMPPMVSLQNINVIEGKLSCNGQMMLSLAMSRGVTYEVKEETDDKCTIIFKRNGYPPYPASFSMNDAQDAGLVGKNNWKKYRKDMLFWRAVAKGVRRVAPEAVMGLYTPDELTDGEVVDVSDYKAPEPQSYEPEYDCSADGFFLQCVDDIQGIEDMAVLQEWAKRNKGDIKASRCADQIREVYATRLAELKAKGE